MANHLLVNIEKQLLDMTDCGGILATSDSKTLAQSLSEGCRAGDGLDSASGKIRKPDQIVMELE